MFPPLYLLVRTSASACTESSGGACPHQSLEDPLSFLHQGSIWVETFRNAQGPFSVCSTPYYFETISTRMLGTCSEIQHSSPKPRATATIFCPKRSFPRRFFDFLRRLISGNIFVCVSELNTYMYVLVHECCNVFWVVRMCVLQCFRLVLHLNGIDEYVWDYPHITDYLAMFISRCATTGMLSDIARVGSRVFARSLEDAQASRELGDCAVKTLLNLSAQVLFFCFYSLW